MHNKNIDATSHTSSSIDNPFTHKKPIDNENDDRKEENGIHPLYPTNIGQPNKGVQVPMKSTKKPTKIDSNYPGPSIIPTKTEPPSKYDNFDNYDDVDEEENDKKPLSPGSGPGPGFFNPTLTKHQYPDYDFNGDNYHRLPPPHTKPQKPNQFNPYIIQHGDGKHELILGGNTQNLPPHLQHVLQQFQDGNVGGGAGVDANGQLQPPYGVHQNQNGLNYPFGIGQHPSLQIPNESNQKIPVQPGKYE